MSALGLFALASWIVMWINAWRHGNDPIVGAYAGLIITLVAVHLVALLAITLPYFVWRAWREKYWG
jgi:Sec-independent protein secretion pathway component TatC